MKNETVIVLDFGGQYNQLIARRVRECNVYCEIYSYKKNLEEIKAMNPKGIILTGGPNSCYEADSPTYTKELFELGIKKESLQKAQDMLHENEELLSALENPTITKKEKDKFVF